MSDGPMPSRLISPRNLSACVIWSIVPDIISRLIPDLADESEKAELD